MTCFIAYIQAVYYLSNKDSPEILVNKDRTKKETFAGVATCPGIDQTWFTVLQWAI